MKIYLKIFKDKNFSDYKTDLILISTNKIKVNDLKHIIFQKYGIEESIQRLSTKHNNKSFIIMTEEFPLFFFKIKEKSVIFIEILERNKKGDDILQKVRKREIKSRYLRRLNIFKNRPNMDIIQESTIEDMDDFESKKNSAPKINSINNYILEDNNYINLNNEIEERLANSIINNKIDEFKEIMFHYNEFIDINKPIGCMKKYSAIHYACKYQYCDMFEELINNYHADVNLISSDGWAPLHISAFKGNLKIINILINFKKTNFDLLLPKKGTALHCACLNNNFKTAALLLHKMQSKYKK